MKKEKLNELNKIPVDINSPEIQKVLWEIHNHSIAFRKKWEKIIKQWDVEDKSNENK